ncbi:MAG: small nuclear ribonucleoprotein (Sm) [Desulfurococcales archaeon]|nr:small nuclear ribonucleoprotein (Sm) [Desulfurococcales archaeon]
MVKLKSGKKLKGVLKSYDQHLNLILNETEEMNEERTRRLGMVLIRGDTVVVISPAK